MTELKEKQLLMEEGWYEHLKEEMKKPYMKALSQFLQTEYAEESEVYPPKEKIFSALCHTPFDKVKVVIMGQDPYHNPGQAHGLAFSVSRGVTTPPSLMNIYKEIQDELGLPIPKTGCLIPWAEQGVLLLNATLTVRKNAPKSHYGKGWEEFTDRIIQIINQEKEGVIFLLWGRSAQEKCRFVSSEKHHLLKSPHPSPFSAHTGFLGNGHFKKVNEILESEGKKPIDWSIQ